MTDNVALNLYAEPIPQISLKELVDTKTDIFARCIKSKKPLLITDTQEVFPSLLNWSPEFLHEKVGARMVNVNTSDTDVFQEYHKEIKMSLSDYSKAIASGNTSDGRRIYMGGQPVSEYFPELQSEIHFDKLLPEKKITLKHLWYGPGGNTTGLHYDSQYNFFIQLYGNKRFLLSEPDSFLNLYPRSAFSNYPRVTNFNPLKPDFERYPKARKVKYFDVMMKPGSVLFISPFWWHQVISYSTIISLNIWLDTPKLMSEWGALQLIPTYIKSFIGHTIFPKHKFEH